MDGRNAWRIVSTTLLGFVCYLCIGLALASLSKFVHKTLGYNLIVAGFAISVQSLSTVLFRPVQGRISDRIGPKKSVVQGLLGCAASGFLLIPAAMLAGTPLASLGVLLLSRFALGFGEGAVATGSTAWGLARVPQEHHTHVMSWAGVASYGAMALGAPLGLWIASSFGVAALGTAIGVVALAGCAFAQGLEASSIFHGERQSLTAVAGKMAPYGFALAFATGGFATIATFVTLYFHARGWAHAALPVSVFGACFVLVRLVGAAAIAHWGGMRVAAVSMVVETAGLVWLARADTAGMALLGAAIAGSGFALVFPAIGMEAVRAVAASDRGAALGIYTAFLDLSMGITGPVAGVAIHHWGYPAGFLLAAGFALCGAAMTGGALRMRQTVEA